jgi:Na+/H+ antiporter NhaD/arsenite permease-like protein
MPESASVPLLMTDNKIYLQAISTGAVFFGAVSYIGNAPNFMVRSIAAESGTAMPSFFGYIFKYSIVFLIPAFVIVTLIFY